MRMRSITGNSTTSIISEKLQIQKSSTTTRPAAQNLLPASLPLVAMRKGDVDVLERKVVLGELLQAENVCVLGRILNP